MKPYYQDDFVTLYQTDALDLLGSLSDGSVDLIATDPPYFRVKNEPWDNAWDDAQGFLAWVDRLCGEFRRVLKVNGSIYFFASPQMGHAVEGVVRRHFRVLSNIRWRKPPFTTKAEMFDKADLRAPFPASETILFAEQLGSDEWADGEVGYTSKCEAAKVSVFGDYLRGEMARAGVSAKQVAALFPSRTGGMTGCVSNWLLGLNCPTSEQYDAIRLRLNLVGGEYLKREYEDLRRQYEDLKREYEDLRRPFFATSDRPYTDVWDFDTVNTYPGKHPCEKPITLCEHIIRTSSRPNGVVLDTFCGSGALLEAARNLGRRAIGGDTSPRWCEWSAQRLSQQILFGDVA